MKYKTIYTETTDLVCNGDVALLKIRQLTGLKACGVKKVIVKVIGVSDEKRAALKGRGK